MPPLTTAPIYFGKFLVTPQVFHITATSFALVNIKPLLPGHVLVSPRRVVPRLQDLSVEEVSDLFQTVQRVGRLVQEVWGATALNIAIQDGADAGQSVPHLHTHIIPRHRADLDAEGGSDAIYKKLEGYDGDVGAHLAQHNRQQSAGEPHELKHRPTFPKVDEAARQPRSEEEMNKEAEMLRQRLETFPG